VSLKVKNLFPKSWWTVKLKERYMYNFSILTQSLKSVHEINIFQVVAAEYQPNVF